MSHATSHDVAQQLPHQEDLTVKNKSKSNTLNSHGNTMGLGYSSSPEKYTVLDMILDALGLRNLTSKDIGALISEFEYI